MTNRPVEQLRQRFLKAAPDLRLNAEMYFWIAEIDGEAVGQLILKRKQNQPEDAELGYVFAPEMRGKGIAERAVRSFMELVLAETPVRSFLARVKRDNVPSRRLLSRLGFEKNGGRGGYLHYRWSASDRSRGREDPGDRPL